MVIGDARLLHAAHANRSSERRTGLTLWYIAQWEHLPAGFQQYWAASARPSLTNRPVSDVAWGLMRSLVPPLPVEGTEPAPPMAAWQGTGPCEVEREKERQLGKL